MVPPARSGGIHRHLTAGVLPQEPALDEGKTVLGKVEEGVAEVDGFRSGGPADIS
jgi:hypothetical protein